MPTPDALRIVPGGHDHLEAVAHHRGFLRRVALLFWMVQFQRSSEVRADPDSGGPMVSISGLWLAILLSTILSIETLSGLITFKLSTHDPQRVIEAP